MKLRYRISAAALLMAAFVWQAAFAAKNSSQSKVPQVIPALQEWKSSKGEIALATKGFVTVSTGQINEIGRQASILADDLRSLMGYSYTVKEGKPVKGGIELRIDARDTTLGAEGYVMEIGKSGVSISALTRQGVMWGTRTLLQMLHNGNGTLACGTVRDWPAYPSRGFMLDTGRKFFTIDFLRDYVKLMSFYKMNEFHVHLNDNGFPQFFDNDWDKTYAAFRLESERFPGLTAKDGHYTKEEFRELQRMGMEYGVNVIPEIDVPAHSLAFTHYKPEIGSKEYGMDHLDIYAPETYAFLDSLFDEYLSGPAPTFIGPDVHIGTDEYNKKEAEQYRYFTDRYLKYIKSYGKTARMWGGLKWLPGKTPVIADDVIINAWSYDWVDPVPSLKEGYRLINTNDRFFYIVPAAGYYRDFLDAEWIYSKWNPMMINHRETLPDGTPGVLGAMFAVWNDKVGNGISERDVHYRVLPAMQVVAEKTWRADNPAVDYKAFADLCAVTPEGPGLNINAAFKGEKLLSDSVILLSGRDSIFTETDAAGYPYAVEFEFMPDSLQAVSGVLFSNNDAKFYTNWEDTGRFAFSRDGYNFTFGDFKLEPGAWTKVRVEGDYKGTSLYVNDRLVQRLEGRRSRHYNKQYKRLEDMYMQETLVFPLRNIGNPINGAKGKIRNIKAIRK